MSKKVKMVLYGVPGVGKSTFASKTPNPLFICTDGNFEWLDLPEKNHIRVSSWSATKNIVNDILAGKYDEFQTIVVDLLEDLYIWAESEFCTKNKIEHIGDYKSMGAGYGIVRKEFFTVISKLISCDKNVIFLSHEYTKVEKNRVGTELFKNYPSNKISIDKQWDDIEGQVRYFLRAFMKPVEIDGKIIKKRYLSLIPKENEYGIARGIDETAVPEDIELDWNVFADIIGLNTPTNIAVEKPIVKQEVKEVIKPEVKIEEVKVEETKPIVEETKVEIVSTEETKLEVDQPVVNQVKTIEEIKAQLNLNKQVVEEQKPIEVESVVEVAVEKPVVTQPVVEEKPIQEMSQEDKIALIKAKFAAINKNK